MLFAVITSSIICTRLLSCVASVAVALGLEVSCASVLPVDVDCLYYIDITPAKSYASAVCACCPADNGTTYNAVAFTLVTITAIQISYVEHLQYSLHLLHSLNHIN